MRDGVGGLIRSPRGSLRDGSGSRSTTPTSYPLEPKVTVTPPIVHLPLPLSWDIAGLSPLTTPTTPTPCSPTTPISPVIPRIISTNWESLGAYDPYR